METIFSQYLAPISVVGTYLCILLIHRYSKISEKYYLLISVITGMTISFLYTSFGITNFIEVLISGALSGFIAYASYKTINKHFFGKDE